MTTGEGPPRKGPGGAPRPPTAARYPEVVTHTRNPVRRVFHFLLASAGWILFAYFWYATFLRQMGPEAWTTLLLLLVVMVGIVAVHLIWVGFNLGIYRARGKRTHVRSVPFRSRRDVLGRALRTPGWELLQASPLVEISIGESGAAKLYTAIRPDGSRAPEPHRSGA